MDEAMQRQSFQKRLTNPLCKALIAYLQRKLLASKTVMERSQETQTSEVKPQLIFRTELEEHPTEREHRVAEQFNWAVQNAFSVSTIIIGIIVGGYAYRTFQATQNQVVIAQQQLDETKNEQRPWIFSDDFSLDPVTDGSPITSHYKYGNSGHLPAINFRDASLFTLFPIKDLTGPIMAWSNPFFDACNVNNTITTGPVIYPASEANKKADFTQDAPLMWKNGNLEGVKNKPGHIATDLKSQEFIIMVNSCFKYGSETAPHHSRFCIYIPPIAGKPPEQWISYSCINGNDAT